MKTGKKLIALNAFLLMVITVALFPAGLTDGSSSSNSKTPFSDKEAIYDLTAGYADEICFTVLENETELYASIQSGASDLLGVTSGQPIEELQGYPDIVATTSNRLGFGHLSINCGKHPTNYTELRQAFAFALDKYLIQERAWNNYSIPIDSPVIPAQGDWSLDNQPWADENNYYDSDPVKGNQILDAHGWNDTDSDGWREDPRGNPVEIVILTQSAQVEMSQISLIANESFASIGIKAVIDYITFFDLLARVATGNYMMAGYAFSLTENPIFIQNFQTDSPDNVYNWSNATFDALVDTMFTSHNTTEAKQACWNAQKILWHEQPMITVYQNLRISYHREDAWTGWVYAIGGRKYQLIDWGGGGAGGVWTFLKVHLRPGLGKTSGEQYTTWQQGGRLNVSLPVVYPEVMQQLNPIFLINGQLSTTYTILDLVYDPLCRRHPYSNDVCPWLAKDWKLEEIDENDPDFAADYPRARSGDRLKITYYLHENLQFHDGYPLTAEDVAFSIDLINKTDSIEPVTHVEVVDETTIEIYCSTPSIINFYGTSFFRIFPKHVLANVKDPEDWENTYPVGSGPYRWRYRNGNVIVLGRNDDFIYNPRNYKWSGHEEPAPTTPTSTATATSMITPPPVPGFTFAAVLTVAVAAFLARRKGKK